MLSATELANIVGKFRKQHLCNSDLGSGLDPATSAVTGRRSYERE